jgi:cytochrome c biogenesis protein CcmG/thiol:disulfide interchange protein DsbE
MVKNPHIWILAGAIAIYLAFASFEDSDRPSLKPESDRKAAPDFAVKDSFGATVKLSDYRGKVVLLNLWATWCAPCRQEIPWFVDFEREFKSRNFAVLGVAMDDRGWDVVQPFVKRHALNYRVMVGDAEVSTLYGGAGALPVTYMIDRDGRIARTHVGVAGRHTYKQEIQDLLSAPETTE